MYEVWCSVIQRRIMEIPECIRPRNEWKIQNSTFDVLVRKLVTCDWSSSLGAQNDYYVEQKNTISKPETCSMKGYVEPQSKGEFRPRCWRFVIGDWPSDLGPQWCCLMIGDWLLELGPWHMKFGIRWLMICSLYLGLGVMNLAFDTQAFGSLTE